MFKLISRYISALLVWLTRKISLHRLWLIALCYTCIFMFKVSILLTVNLHTKAILFLFKTGPGNKSMQTRFKCHTSTHFQF